MKTPKFIVTFGSFCKDTYLDIIEDIKFWLIKRKANLLHKKNGTRYHVIEYDNRLIIVDNNGKTNEGFYIGLANGKKIPFMQLIKRSYYSTSVNSPVLRNRAIPKTIKNATTKKH